MHRVTIRDVARHAGVSVATVSRVINQSDTVSPALSRRVQDAIAALGFEPDFLARSWRTRETRTIAAVISDNTSPHHGIMLRKAGDAALAHDYSLILCTSFFDIETERRYLRMLRERRTDGVLLNSVGDCSAEIRGLNEVGAPVVMLNRPLPKAGHLIDAVLADSYRGAFDLVDHLIRLGHRRIAMLYSTLNTFHREERIRGYLAALNEHGLSFEPSLVREALFPPTSNRALPEEALCFASRPTAIFAAGYDIGLAVMSALRRQGRRVPDDIAFAMFDDVQWGALVDPPLTVVQNPSEEMGETALRLLFARLADPKRAPQEIRLPPRLVVRRSCGASGDMTDAVGVAALVAAPALER